MSVRGESRTLGGFAIFALTISAISLPTNVTTTFGTGLVSVGPIGIGLGWPLVAIASLVLGLAIAELTSALPRAGGIYAWTAVSAGPAWGWIVGALNLWSQTAILIWIDFECARAIAAGMQASTNAAYPIVAVLLATQVLVSIHSVRVVAIVAICGALVVLVGAATLAIALVTAREHGPAWLIATRPPAGGSVATGFVGALVLGMWQYTGYETAANLGEETRDETRAGPRGLLVAVGVAGIVGYLLVSALAMAVADYDAIAQRPDDGFYIVTSNAIGPAVSALVHAVTTASRWVLGLVTLTTASRVAFAMARDGGLPSRLTRPLRSSHATPSTSILFVAALAMTVVLASVAVPHILLTTLALTSAGVYLSYGAALAFVVLARLRSKWRPSGTFQLGRCGIWIGGAASLWCAFVVVVCCLPPYQ